MKQMKRITLRLSLENPSDKKIADFLANIDKNKYHTVSMDFHEAVQQALHRSSRTASE